MTISGKTSSKIKTCHELTRTGRNSKSFALSLPPAHPQTQKFTVPIIPSRDASTCTSATVRLCELPLQFLLRVSLPEKVRKLNGKK